jgi:NitT/TauT family transport system substrate-binding protein
LEAWDIAASMINEEPDAYRELLLSRIRVPQNIQKTYVIPPYPRNSVPDQDQWMDVIDWMIQKGLLRNALPYQSSVTKAFLK